MKGGEVPDKPSEFVLKKAFSSFGDIRIVDIPMLDPYRQKVNKSSQKVGNGNIIYHIGLREENNRSGHRGVSTYFTSSKSSLVFFQLFPSTFSAHFVNH